MRAVLLLLLAALVCLSGARAEETTMSQELAAVAAEEEAGTMDVAADLADEDEQASEEEEEEEEAMMEEEEEEEQQDEAEEEEGEEEGEEEFSLLESDAEADSEKPKKPAKIVGKAKAPAPIVKFHSERIVAQTSKNEDPEMAKLDLALAAVKEDILSTNKQITDERKWVIAVAKIIASYNDKMKRVEAHIIALRKEMKALYRKKKQIENLKLQRALEAKLKEARDELATLTGSLKHVQLKKGELDKSGSDLRQTIAGIQAQLAKLRGQQLRKPKPSAKGKKCGKGQRYSKKAKKCVARKAKKAGKKF